MNEEIETLIEKSVLASPPSLLLKIINSLDSELNSKQISDIVGHDPSIAAQVLKLSNSSFFGFKGNIKTLDKAINVLGTKTVRNIAVTTLLFTHTNKVKLHNINILTFWLKSFLVADITREIATKIGLDGDEAYIAGLLHGIGKIILYSQPQGPTDIFIKKHTSTQILKYEEKTWGVNSSELSKVLLERWNIPTGIVDSIYEHGTIKGKTTLSQVIYLANEFASIATDEFHASKTTYPVFKKLIRELSIKKRDLKNLYLTIPDIVERGKLMMKVIAKNAKMPRKTRKKYYKISLVSNEENSLSWCILNLLNYKVHFVTPEEIQKQEEVSTEDTSVLSLPEDVIDEMEKKKIAFENEENEKKDSGILARAKTSILTRLFRRKIKEEVEIEEEPIEEEEEIVEYEANSILWQQIVLFEDVDPIEINKPFVKKVFQIFMNPAKIKGPTIPLFFTVIDIEKQ